MSGPAEPSFQRFQYTIAILDKSTVKSDADFLKVKSELLNIPAEY